jgi:uncharacterized membrane protein HdeD (DUF308 family)
MNRESTLDLTKKASPWLVGWGAVIFVCGILAVILPLTFSVAISIVIGAAVLAAGIAHLVFAFHTRSAGGFFWQICVTVLYGAVAVCLLVNPLLGVLSLTLFLGIFLLLEGLLELALYFRLKGFRHSFWLLVDGIGTAILGVVMLAQWPPASPEIIGALIGISMMLSAASRVIFSVAVHALDRAPSVTAH